MNSESRIATSTNLLCFKRGARGRKMTEIVPLLKEAGYQNIDLNFCEMMNPESKIDQSYLDELRSFDVNYNQCHVPYASSGAKQDEVDKLIIASLSYAGALGVDVAVIHPVKGSVDDNIAYFKTILPHLPKNMKLAIENMERKEEISSASDLLAIVKGLNCPSVGVCLDTGHAHIMGYDLPKMIKELGSALIATHIADNHGLSDEHYMPFFGNTPWEDVMKAFSEINYKGYFTYEIMYFFKYLPEDIQEDVATLSMKVAKKLVSLL